MLLSNQITLMADQMLAQHPTLRLLRGTRTPHLRLTSSHLISPHLATQPLPPSLLQACRTHLVITSSILT